MSLKHTLTAFLAWAEENNIHWDKDAIEIREGKHGLGIYAKKNLDAGYEAIQVPKSIVLSVESTGIANLLEEEDIEGYVGLTLACMYEYSKGSESVWSEYLALLALSRPQMPSDLSEDARELLKKSEVFGDIETDLNDMQEDYDTIVVPLLDKHPEVFPAQARAEFFTYEAFKYMTSHVSSRAMDVDNFHISALVPFADLVNHHADANADYLTHEEVCEVCGAISCEHMDEDDEDGEDDEEAPELAAEDDKKKRSAAKKAEAADVDGEDDDEEDDEDWEDDINDTCDIVLDDDVKKGEEITRHYGPFPNKIFLSKYGFAEIDNEHDTVTVQLEMVKKAAETILGDPALVEERTKWFLETEDIFIGEDDDDELEGGCCEGDHDHDHEHHHHEHKHVEAGEAEAESESEDEEDSDDEAEEDDFPRDIMEIMHDGSIDDRLLMLLNVLFMEKEQFAKVEESVDAATEYFNDIFLRRAIEEDLAEDSEDDEEQPKPELKPLDDAGRRVRKNVLEAILQVIRLRADAYDVSDKTSAEEDLELLNKAGLSGTLYYGALCVIGEKKVLQNALTTYNKFLNAL
ncbi:hypothetical protein BGZ95_009792 [Linnemannia exigua]|uniref:SET domain-containing protein n=1 Tax=Linnemannia exigua TaxID=604196 RepID=A0AAD4H6G8_9FUNG|nr:hypothetical protein BGZ95_009792 [Linnemannia exigua]